FGQLLRENLKMFGAHFLVGVEVLSRQRGILVAIGVGLSQAPVVKFAAFGSRCITTLFDLAEARGVYGVNGNAIRLSELHMFGECIVGVLSQENRRLRRRAFGE